MPRITPSTASRSGWRRWRRLALGAAVVLGAAASAPGVAEATTPTAPPPVTILTS